MQDEPTGFCDCGCGGKTTQLAYATNGAPAGTYRRFIKGHNGNRVSHRAPLSYSESRQIVDLYKAGHSRNKVAQTLGVSHNTVTAHLKRHGVELERRDKKGAEHHRWTGRGRIDSKGYVRVKLDASHPFAASMANPTRGGTVFEHRLVMAEHLGRPLEAHETVHHLNGVRWDNRIENLQLLTDVHPRGANLRCADCGSKYIVGEPIPQWPGN